MSKLIQWWNAQSKTLTETVCQGSLFSTISVQAGCGKLADTLEIQQIRKEDRLLLTIAQECTGSTLQLASLRANRLESHGYAKTGIRR